MSTDIINYCIYLSRLKFTDFFNVVQMTTSNKNDFHGTLLSM